MKNFLKNPLTLWFYRLIQANLLEYKNKNKYLKIGYMSIVKNCTFGMYNTIYNDVNLSKVSLGNFTYIAGNTQISRTSIGSFCSIGSNCKIGLGKHPVQDFVSTHPIFFSTLKQSQITFADKEYFEEYEDIEIGNDVWIGTNVIIIDGVKIGDGAIIAAGSVVTKNIPPYMIVGGIPAKIIRYRFEEKDINQLLELKWWDMDIEYLKKNYKKFHDIRRFLNEE